MKRLFRNWIRAEPEVYRCVRIIRSKKMRYPTSSTKITIEGYPRSGNTFAYYMVRSLSKPELISSHYHNIASLKSSMSLSVPTIVLIRDPLDSVSSLVLMNNTQHRSKEIASSLFDWIEYYSFVEQHLDYFKLLEFNRMISEPYKFALWIRSLMKLELSNDEVKKRVLGAEEKLKIKEKDKDPNASSMPVVSRDLAKKEVKKVIEKLPAFVLAQELWVRLQPRVDINFENQ